MALRSVLSGVTSCQSNAQVGPMGRPGHLRYETELWQSHHRLVYLGVLAGPHRAAPTEDDTIGAESRQVQEAAWGGALDRPAGRAERLRLIRLLGRDPNEGPES